MSEKVVKTFQGMMTRQLLTMSASQNLKSSQVWWHLSFICINLNPLSANPTKWSNTCSLFPMNCLSVFDQFVGLVLKGLKHDLYLNKVLALYISPIFSAILFSVNFECTFHNRLSSNKKPINQIDDCPFISFLLVERFGNTTGESCLLVAL